MLEAIPETFPDAKYQRCTVHFYRNDFTVVPRGKVREVIAVPSYYALINKMNNAI